MVSFLVIIRDEMVVCFKSRIKCFESIFIII